MSFVLTRLHEALKHGVITKAVPVRCFTRATVCRSEETFDESNETTNTEEVVDPTKDRRNPIPVETSIRYLASDAYKTTYGDKLVWELFRRNHKGGIPPRKTRKTCVRQGFISTGSPCPICRDEYLVLDYRNTGLLKQFISNINGEIFSYQKTNICQRQHQKLLIALYLAKDYGTITYEVPFRKYNYSEWYKPEEKAL